MKFDLFRANLALITLEFIIFVWIGETDLCILIDLLILILSFSCSIEDLNSSYLLGVYVFFCQICDRFL